MLGWGSSPSPNWPLPATRLVDTCLHEGANSPTCRSHGNGGRQYSSERSGMTYSREGMQSLGRWGSCNTNPSRRGIPVKSFLCCLCSNRTSPYNDEMSRGVEPSLPGIKVLEGMEPARAVTAIQSFLDSSKASCALLADLSKAFERVNPYWILALLRSKGAPAWVIRYSRFVLFERRVTHKVQGRLLPSRVIRQGVDMGDLSRFSSFALRWTLFFISWTEFPGTVGSSICGWYYFGRGCAERKLDTGGCSMLWWRPDSWICCWFSLLLP